jgi:Flp pilus assembly pilin Flp
MRHKNDDGATAVEYALLAVLIAAVVAGAIVALGVATVDNFDALSWP